MILFQNRLIVLDYDPKTDILSVEWPSLSPYDLLEIEQALKKLVEYIRDYDVKNLLIDSTRAAIHPDMDMERYQAIVTEFALSLTQTRLQKSARIMHTDHVREATSQEISAKITKKAKLVIENRNFTGKEQALAWLSS
ncbi:MAG: hypothetical protein ACO1OQ_15420 [Rufibacter sp.]